MLKKTILALLALTLLIFTGCAGKTADAGPPETHSAAPSAAASDGPAVDLTDENALYAYVKSEIADIPREDFDTWEIYYCDITGEGTDEAVLVSPYGANWHKKIEILSGDSGVIQPVGCDAYAGKYGTYVDFIDGFLTIQAANGGSGEHFTDMDLLAYDGSQMVCVLGALRVEHEVGSQDANYYETGEIEGALTDFIYTLTKTDSITERTTVVQKTQYTYNAETMAFDEKPLPVDSDQAAPSGEEEGEGVRLTGFTDEAIRGLDVQYSEYAAVIIPMYPSSGANLSALSSMPFIDHPDGYTLDVAVFGTLQSVTITRYDGGAVGDRWSVGDLTDTLLVIHSNLQSDMSYYEMTGTVHVGEGLYEDVCLTMDDMRDASEYDIFLIW